jgi:hydrogenase expression/formation protein HypC
MCLAVPGRIVEIANEGPLTRRGKVDFGGLRKDVNLMLVPEAKVGDYVMVHVGIAISVVDEEEAQRVFEFLRQTVPEDLEELASESEPKPGRRVDASSGKD